MDKLTCATCDSWSAKNKPGQFLGDCILGVFYGRPTFDYQGCAYHSERGKADTAMQSACRGMTMQEWQRKLGVT